jgi:hypothetical protein
VGLAWGVGLPWGGTLGLAWGVPWGWPGGYPGAGLGGLGGRGSPSGQKSRFWVVYPLGLGGTPGRPKLALFCPTPQEAKISPFLPYPPQEAKSTPQARGLLNNILLAHFSDFPKLPQGGGCRKKGVPGTFFLASPVPLF